MKLHDYFAGLMQDTVNLNQSRLDDLDRSVEAIFKCLSTDEDLGSSVEEFIPQGSWAHETIIRPQADREFDADILLVLTEDPSKEPKEYLSDVAAALRRSNTYKDMVTQKNRCVRVTYAKNFHVDVVPYILRTGGGVIVNKAENSFEATNPEGFTEWMRYRDAGANGNLRRVVRLVKFLRDYKTTFSVPSVILTNLLSEQVSTFDAANRYSDTPTALRHLLGDLAIWLDARPDMPWLADPSCPQTSFNHRWDQDRYANFRRWMRYYADKVAAAYDEPDSTVSLELWREVFGDAFQKRSMAASVVSKSAWGLEVRAPTEQYITDRYPEQLGAYTATITATVDRKKGFRHGSLRSTGYRVPKGRWLTFKVTTDVPAPSEVFWKVRNGGAEAYEVPGGLRGQIQADEGARERRESTSYQGEHYVECYIVKNGVCLAKARVPVRVV